MEALDPWKITPSELTKQAIELLLQRTDTSLRIAYLLFDVAIENMFKTFLLLSDSITGAKIKYPKRKEGTEGGFNTLIETMKKLELDQISDEDLDKIKYYHDIRNKLYHQGDGVIPTEKNTQDYASLVTEFLFQLFSVDLRPFLFKEDEKRELLQRRNELVEKKFEPIKKELEEALRRINLCLIRLLEDRDLEFAKKSFADNMEDFITQMSTSKARSLKSGIRRLLNEGLFILDDDDIPIGCYQLGESGYEFYEFLERFVEENLPTESIPEELVDYLELHGLDYSELFIAEIITSDDFTEVLLLITDHLDKFPKVISIDDYRKARCIISWNYDERILDDKFEEKLQETVKDGNQLFEQIRQDLNKL